MRLRKGYVFIVAASLIALIVSAVAYAQPSPANVQHFPLARLNRALESSGAAALSQDQQQTLESLISAYRSAHPRGAPDAAMQSARLELENSILNGDDTGVASAAGKIATEISSRAKSMIVDKGQFEISVMKTLTSDQVNALKTQFGDAGFVRILGSLSGRRFNRPRFGGLR